MNNNELINLKKQISQLSIEKQKERNIHLREIALGNEKGEKTGYPSIDKPWLKYYTKEQISYDIPNYTCYELLYKNNSNKLNDIAIDYFGKKLLIRNCLMILKKQQKHLLVWE